MHQRQKAQQQPVNSLHSHYSSFDQKQAEEHEHYSSQNAKKKTIIITSICKISERDPTIKMCASVCTGQWQATGEFL